MGEEKGQVDWTGSSAVKLMVSCCDYTSFTWCTTSITIKEFNVLVNVFSVTT